MKKEKGEKKLQKRKKGSGTCCAGILGILLISNHHHLTISEAPTQRLLIASFFYLIIFVLCPWGENPVFQSVSRPTRISPKEIEFHFYSRRLFCPHITVLPPLRSSRLSQSVVQLKRSSPPPPLPSPPYALILTNTGSNTGLQHFFSLLAFPATFASQD